MARALSATGAAIREYLSKHPDIGNKDVAEAVGKALSCEVSPTQVAAAKQALKKNAAEALTFHLPQPQTLPVNPPDYTPKMIAPEAQGALFSGKSYDVVTDAPLPVVKPLGSLEGIRQGIAFIKAVGGMEEALSILALIKEARS